MQYGKSQFQNEGQTHPEEEDGNENLQRSLDEGPTVDSIQKNLLLQNLDSAQDVSEKFMLNFQGGGNSSVNLPCIDYDSLTTQSSQLGFTGDNEEELVKLAEQFSAGDYRSTDKHQEQVNVELSNLSGEEDSIVEFSADFTLQRTEEHRVLDNYFKATSESSVGIVDPISKTTSDNNSLSGGYVALEVGTQEEGVGSIPDPVL